MSEKQIIPFPGDGMPSDQPLISEPQTLTGTWTDLGIYEIPVERAQGLTVLWEVELNNSKRVRMRLKGRTRFEDEKDFVLHAATGELAVNNEYYEFPDESISQDARFEIKKSIPIVWVQVMVGTVGANPGRILSAKITVSQ
jgi:hypothetical protein